MQAADEHDQESEQEYWGQLLGPLPEEERVSLASDSVEFTVQTFTFVDSPFSGFVGTQARFCGPRGSAPHLSVPRGKAQRCVQRLCS
jgi:hypothetical protein